MERAFAPRSLLTGRPDSKLENQLALEFRRRVEPSPRNLAPRWAAGMHPVIIIGTGRSGTSELWRIMLNKFDYAMAYEPRFVVPLSKKQHGDLSAVDNQR